MLFMLPFVTYYMNNNYKLKIKKNINEVIFKENYHSPVMNVDVTLFIDIHSYI